MNARLAAFGHALRGFGTLLQTQPHARFHALATVVVVAGGVYFKISAHDWALLALAMGTVWTAEALNTSIEFLADELTLERRDRIKYAKDIAAFAVLASASGALAVGALVFVPYLLHRG